MPSRLPYPARRASLPSPLLRAGTRCHCCSRRHRPSPARAAAAGLAPPHCGVPLGPAGVAPCAEASSELAGAPPPSATGEEEGGEEEDKVEMSFSGPEVSTLIYLL